MLSIFASNAIALPLSPAFPTSELQYIMDNSSAKILLATEKYAEKADQILVSGLDREPIFDVRSKLRTGANESIQVQLEQPSDSISGMMLYTSGTTNRPVSLISTAFDVYMRWIWHILERSSYPRLCPRSTSKIPLASMEVLTRGPITASPPPAPYPWCCECNRGSCLCWLFYWIHVPFQYRCCMETARRAILKQQQQWTVPNHLSNCRPNCLQSTDGFIPNIIPGNPIRRPRSHFPIEPPPQHLRLCSSTNPNKKQMD